jgi:Putative Ig domain
LRLTGKTGVISGTPKVRGAFSFTVQVTDSKKPKPNRVTTKTFSITIT